MSNSIRLTVFGSSAGFPTRERTNTAIGLWRGGALYLFDAGEPVAAHLARRGISPDTLQAVFITHMHADHTGGLPMLLQWLQLNHRARPLLMYLPSEATEAFLKLLDMHYLYPELLGFDLDLRPVEAGPVHQEDGLTVMALANRHLEGMAARLQEAGRRQKAQSFSYALTVDGKRLLLSGDVRDPEELAGPAAGTDLVVTELAHFPPEALGEAMASAEVPRLVVTHLLHTLEPVEREVPARIKAAGFGGDVQLARDGDEFAL